MLEIYQNPPTLENERIKLIPMEMDHVQPLFAMSDSGVWEFMLTEVKTEKQMHHWVEKAVELRREGTALPFVVILKETNQLVGTTRLFNIDFNQKACEIGSTWYGPRFRRTFVNSDCKFLLLQFCFEEMRFIRVQLKTDERNIRSQKAIERMGAVKEGVLRNERILDNGYIRNAVLYSITKEEWPTVKEGFIRRNALYES